MLGSYFSVRCVNFLFGPSYFCSFLLFFAIFFVCSVLIFGSVGLFAVRPFFGSALLISVCFCYFLLFFSFARFLFLVRSVFFGCSSLFRFGPSYFCLFLLFFAIFSFARFLFLFAPSFFGKALFCL